MLHSLQTAHENRMKRSLATTIERLFGWTINCFYLCLLLVVSPVLAYRSIRFGKYRNGWSQKLFGSLPELARAKGNRFWLHAVSVGEVLLLKPILDQLLLRHPTAEIVITSTTSTGFAVAKQQYSKRPDGRRNIVCYFPLDFTWAVARSLRRIQPTHVVLVELELWPNFILAAHRSGVSLQLINARLSQKSFQGYSRIRGLMRNLLARFDVLAVQNDEYANRLISLGADEKRVLVTGSIKFDRVNRDRENDATKSLRLAFGLYSGERVFIAGSTQEPEERIAIEAWQSARQVDPGLRLILVPRHQERFAEVARLVSSLGLNLLRRSTKRCEPDQETALTSNMQNDPAPVILLDTLGELSACWGLADFAFVGGSLSNRGGQNMIEPAAYGAAVCFGPNTRNFRDIVDQLISRDAARVVQDQHELAETLIEWIQQPMIAQGQGQRAKQFVASQHGAAQRTVDAILGQATVLKKSA
jgi:3-deoxy-D-manno-octulosonic-acid transferase